MKKILLSVSYYAPHMSGLTSCIVNLSTALARKKYSISVLTTQFDKYTPLFEEQDHVVIRRIPYLFKVSKGFFMPRFFIDAISSLQRVDEVIVVLPQVEGFFVAFLAKMMGKKVISYYICDVTLSGGILTKMVENLLRMMNVLCLNFSDDIFTLTDDFAKNTAVLANHKSTKELLPIVSEQIMNEDAKKILLNKMPEGKKYVIGFLGRIASEKGIEYLLGAMHSLQKHFLDNFVIVLAGPKQVVGEAKYQARITKLINENNSSIIQLGELSNDSLAAFYSLLDVFVLPSINQTEAFGMVQLEAMRAGVPVVATNLPGVRVPIQKTGMGISVPVKDSQAIGEAIIEILNNEPKFQKGREKARVFCSEREVVAKFETLIAS